MSASGGLFDELAKCILNESGVIQSDTADTFKQTKRDLVAGRRVLYSGTPCQIAGLYEYLGKEYDNLLTVDIICHGVPSYSFLGNMLPDYRKKKYQY